MEGIWSTSLLFPPQAPVSPPAALFCGEDEYGCHLEVNPRVDGSVYVCGCGGSKYLDNAALAALDPKDVTPNPARVKAALESLSAKTSLPEGRMPEANACIRPCPPDARPLIGKVLENGFLAAGHNCWGILWGPLTGRIVADLLTGAAPEVDLRAFEPSRFTERVKGRGRKRQTEPVGEQW